MVEYFLERDNNLESETWNMRSVTVLSGGIKRVMWVHIGTEENFDPHESPSFSLLSSLHLIYLSRNCQLNRRLITSLGKSLVSITTELKLLTIAEECCVGYPRCPEGARHSP